RRHPETDAADGKGHGGHAGDGEGVRLDREDALVVLPGCFVSVRRRLAAVSLTRFWLAREEADQRPQRPRWDDQVESPAPTAPGADQAAQHEAERRADRDGHVKPGQDAPAR